MQNKQSLCAKTINDDLKKINLPLAFNLSVLDSVDSTNRHLKDYASKNEIDICIAEHQSKGRGRLGKAWHSPYAENIYLSCRWPFSPDMSKLQGLSLVISLAIYDSLRTQGIKENLSIKWPNDVMWQHQKLAGTLIELVQTQQQQQTDVIIGIGLNVNSDTLIDLTPDKAWCSMYSITGHQFDRNHICALLIKNLADKIMLFKQFGLQPFIDEWSAVDYLAGKMIRVITASSMLEGLAQGIDEIGRLKLLDKAGVIQILDVGEPSIQAILD